MGSILMEHYAQKIIDVNNIEFDENIEKTLNDIYARLISSNWTASFDDTINMKNDIATAYYEKFKYGLEILRNQKSNSYPQYLRMYHHIKWIKFYLIKDVIFLITLKLVFSWMFWVLLLFVCVVLKIISSL